MSVFEDFKIDDLNQLKWLLLVVAAAAFVVYGFTRKSRALRAFASANLLGVLIPDMSRPRQAIRAILVLAAMICIVLGLVGPRWGTYYDEAVSRQLDMVVCLDVSKSMLAEDAGMSRLDRAKDDIKQLLESLHGGSIGLVAFAGRSELVCPLTDDYEFYRLALEDVGIHSAPLGGTNLASAIGAAVKTFDDEGGRKQRAIILMTDGEDHGDEAEAAANKAREQGIAVYTIGIGDSDRGAMVPVVKNGQRTFLKHGDEQVWSKMDPSKLKAIAMAGGGEYQPSRQVDPRRRTLEWLYANKLAPKEERSKQDQRVRRQYARFTWFVAPALALLLLETLVSERRAGNRSAATA